MRNLIIDTDCGLDDASAIILALSDPATRVLAITTVDGNTRLGNVVQNVLRVLRSANRLDIPVFRGSSCSLLNLCSKQAYHHGKDGLGDYAHHEPVDFSLVQSEHAVNGLIRIAHEAEEIELACLGPLTNLALAVRLDPSLCSRIKRLSLMGGNYKSRGNITIASEFNFYRDPEAAHIILSSFKCNAITMVGWEVCCENIVSPERMQQLIQADTKKAAFVRSIYANALENRSPIIFCDEVAVACLIRPDIIVESETARVCVELGGLWCRGMAVPDWNGAVSDCRQPMVTIVTKFDMEKLQTLLRQSLKL